MGPPKNTRFVFFTNNREEAKGNTLDCNVYFSLSGHNEAKAITKSHLHFNVTICYFIFIRDFRSFSFRNKRKVKNIF